MLHKFIPINVSIFLLLTSPLTAWSQFDSLFDSLDEKMHRGEITTNEWYHSKLSAGYIFEFAAKGWVQSMDSFHEKSPFYKSLKGKSGLILHVPKHYQIIKENGNRYIQAYIVNLTDTTVSISRKDATIRLIETYLFVNKEWKQIKKEYLPACGNGFWSQELAPGCYLSIQIENHDISLGNVKVKQKIRLKIGDFALESEEVTALLNDKQISFLKQVD